MCTLKKVNCWKGAQRCAHNQQPIKGSPKAKAMEPGKGSETIPQGSREQSRSAPSLETEMMIQSTQDEVDYWLYPEEVRQVVPVVERLWLEPGQRVFPHVKLKCESSLSLYWDKGGVEWPDVQWDANGLPILEPPEFVQNIYKERSQLQTRKDEKRA